MKKILKFFVPALALIAMASCTKAEQVGWLTVGDQYFEGVINIPAEGAANVAVPFTSFNNVFGALFDRNPFTGEFSHHNTAWACFTDPTQDPGDVKDDMQLDDNQADEGKHRTFYFNFVANDYIALISPNPALGYKPVPRTVYAMITNGSLPDAPVAFPVVDIDGNPVVQNLEEGIIRMVTFNQDAAIFQATAPVAFNQFPGKPASAQSFKLQSTYADVESINVAVFANSTCTVASTKFQVTPVAVFPETTHTPVCYGQKNYYKIEVNAVEDNDTHESINAYLRVMPKIGPYAVKAQQMIIPISQAPGCFYPITPVYSAGYHEFSDNVKFTRSLDIEVVDTEVEYYYVSTDHDGREIIVEDEDCDAEGWLTITQEYSTGEDKVMFEADANNDHFTRVAKYTVYYTHHGADEGPVSFYVRQVANPLD